MQVATLKSDACLYSAKGPNEQVRLIAAGRLFDIENVMHGFRSAKEATTLPAKHRARACDYWKQLATGRPCPATREGGSTADKEKAKQEIERMQSKIDRQNGKVADVVTRSREALEVAEQAKRLDAWRYAL